MNECKNCGFLSTSEFYKNKNKKSGLSSYCKTCDKDRMAEWRGSKTRRGPRPNKKYTVEYRKNYLDSIRSIPCKDCNNSFSAVSMDFDHLPQYEKSFGIMKVWRWKSWDLVLAEIDKCEIICSNCHRVRTRNRREQRLR